LSLVEDSERRGPELEDPGYHSASYALLYMMAIDIH
jgi:hypothetical protein